MAAEGPTIILDVFSGKPNPNWTLSSEQVNQLKNMLSDLSESTSVEAPPLGYRGFIIQNSSQDPDLPDEIRAYNQILSIDRGGDMSFKQDTNNIEGWLVNQANTLGYGEIIEKFRTSSFPNV